MSWVGSLALILVLDVIVLTYISTMCPSILRDKKIRILLEAKLLLLLLVVVMHNLTLIMIYAWVCFLTLVAAGYKELSMMINNLKRDRHARDHNERE